MLLVQTLRDLAIFAVATFGLGSALAPRHAGEPLLRLALGIVCSLGLQFLLAFGVFAAGGSNPLGGGIAVVLVAGIGLARRHAALELLTTPEVRHFLLLWLVFAAWSLGLLALVVSYSGGGWAVDWLEHWQRTQFFLERRPLDTVFGYLYGLTARPPLVNVVVALWLEGTARTFSDYQVFVTLWSSIVLLPAVMLARRWRPAATTGAWVLLLLMLSPMVAQNLTFAWTKLPTAFFVLTGFAATLAALDDAAPSALGPMVGLCLGFGLLSHYSAGPWIIAIGAGYLCGRVNAWRRFAFWREVTVAAALLLVVTSVWLAWSIGHFGSRTTVGSTTTAGAWSEQSPAQRILVPLLNLRDTLVPFPLRGEPQDRLIVQTSRLGRARDVAFNVYQVNLPLAVGASGLFVLAIVAARGRRRAAAPDSRRFYITAIPLAIVGGILVHTPRDQWGLTHICLQPLVILALARIATLLPALEGPIRRVWAILAAVDFTLGIALHFALQSWAMAGWVAPGAGAVGYVRSLGPVASANLRDKVKYHLAFFADPVAHLLPLVGLWLALCLLWAIFQVRRDSAPSSC
ncbi:hypothetical protein [Opitutus sp. ER46]|uniref:hypothetical protein n=1 Tax=Opitutus sp. ER46 TaxID=2161864 RepID=UPI000D2F4886|nr:hypothetical protein [Opitutus sp. ER46]PTX95547.1 hypothetical protein DB354_08990 [Opitutus sp. ER46]